MWREIGAAKTVCRRYERTLGGRRCFRQAAICTLAQPESRVAFQNGCTITMTTITTRITAGISLAMR